MHTILILVHSDILRKSLKIKSRVISTKATAHMSSRGEASYHATRFKKLIDRSTKDAIREGNSCQ